MRPRAVFTALLLTLSGAGQPVNLVLNGSMTVAVGTSIVISDTLVWQFASGSSLVNDGFIDLGSGATLDEPDGQPVTGSGTERSMLALNTAGPGIEPGGLGLTLDLTEADGMLSITRGHLPRVAGNGVEGVARWYFLEAAGLASSPFPVSMQVDGSELNGLASDELALHVSVSSDGPWAQIPTSVGPSSSLEGTLPGTGLHLTAFEPDLITAAEAGSALPGSRVWPTVAQDVVHVESMDHATPLVEVEVFDAIGRRVLRHVPAAGSGSSTLDIQGIAPGHYLIRVNNNETFRVVRP